MCFNLCCLGRVRTPSAPSAQRGAASPGNQASKQLRIFHNACEDLFAGGSGLVSDGLPPSQHRGLNFYCSSRATGLSQLLFGVRGQRFFLIHAQTLFFSPGYNQQILLPSILSRRALIQCLHWAAFKEFGISFRMTSS